MKYSLFMYSTKRNYYWLYMRIGHKALCMILINFPILTIMVKTLNYNVTCYYSGKNKVHACVG